ncbi:tetratricopeptide repeat protein [Ramlibacter tataouinensis]|uniref:tetratricopeptide repeat protein n=1 Tax=Ramlibacter tataouinensis TaxID=94132 RepID=UPI0022F3FFD6|nr:tetratricopeptide repeat protein [Ramlibacter tataouinensis]WBY00506.1 tetratricopeptide repeat protein [Ramlibacter tataouinensis]
MVWMNRSSRLAWGALLLIALAQAGCAQTGPAAPQAPAQAGAGPAASEPDPVSSALDAELFYQLLLSELNARGPEPAAAFSLMLDAARKTDDPALYQRAVEIAFQSRAGDAALQAARAWKQAHPASRDANRYVLQILLALNRVPEAMEPLRTELTLAGERDRAAVLTAIPRLFARVSDKPQAAALVEQAVQPQLADPASAAVAWTTVGRMRLAAGDNTGALVAAQLAQAADAQSESPVLLALELMDPRLPQAEPIVRKYLQGRALPELRMGYARALIDAQRYTEAAQQLQLVTRDKPELAQGWLALGTLQVQESRLKDAEASLKKYVELAQTEGSAAERSRGLAQAYLALAQVAEKRRDFAAANAWLDRIDNSQDLVAAQSRRASILAQQGRLDEARKLIHALPERTPLQARAKLSAEVQLLREQKRYKAAYDLLDKAIAKEPGDPDLLYDQAMLAEKMDRLGDMERLLRQVMAAKPDFHHAYNALGYSLADRGVRLPEARQLIRKALEFAPGDPYITDSLGWVEFRMGNRAEALRILEGAYKDRPDAEIAAHLGEVLWSMGQHDKAQAIWREGLLLNRDNETLQQTIKRLGVKP